MIQQDTFISPQVENFHFNSCICSCYHMHTFALDQLHLLPRFLPLLEFLCIFLHCFS